MFYQLTGFLATFVIGSAGFLLFRALRLPTPALLGSICATAALNIAGYYPVFPLWPVSFVSNVAIGLIIGRQIDRGAVRKVRELSLSVAGAAAGMIVLSLLCGLIFYHLTNVSLDTALIASTAGGITEMMIFGISLDADLAVIACVQLFRIVATLTMIPVIVTLEAKRSGIQLSAPMARAAAKSTFTALNYTILIVAGCAGAALGIFFNIPAGGMLGAMLAGGAYAVTVAKRYNYDPRVRHLAQIAAGMVMGQRVTLEMVLQLRWILLPTLVTTVVMIAGSVAIAWAMHKLKGWELLTCLLCTSPAGVSQIVIYAEEIGADSLTVSIFHTVRIVSIVSLFPWIVLWAAR